MKNLVIFLLVFILLSSSSVSLEYVRGENIYAWTYVLYKKNNGTHEEIIWVRSLDGGLRIEIFNDEKSLFCPKTVCPKGEPHYILLFFKDHIFELTISPVKINFGLEEIVFPNNDPIKIDEKLFRS